MSGQPEASDRLRASPGSIAALDATALAAAIRRKELSSVEVLDAMMERIDRLNPAINAVVTLALEQAAAEASRCDRLLAAGEPTPALHGVPITVKDTIETRGLRTTAGARRYASYVPDADAPVVARLRNAGAIVVGKCNVPKLASDFQTSNELFGRTNNPWRLDRTPGGSSGGSAAAVAAGISPLDIGSEMAGSLALPAHYCGVFAHKPTYGVVPSAGHIPPPPGSRADRDILVLGPLARSARDLALALDLISGTDPRDPWQFVLPAPRLAEPASYRVAAWIEQDGFPMDPCVADQLRRVLRLVDGEIGAMDLARPDIGPRRVYELGLALVAGAASAGLSEERFVDIAAYAGNTTGEDRSSAALWARGAAQLHRDWLRAQEDREQQRAAWASFFRRYDILLCPVAPVVAYPHDADGAAGHGVVVAGERRDYYEQSFWPLMLDVGYLPFTVVPVGLSMDGLPVAMAVVAAEHQDRKAIQFAEWLASLSKPLRSPIVGF